MKIHKFISAGLSIIVLATQLSVPILAQETELPKLNKTAHEQEISEENVSENAIQAEPMPKENGEPKEEILLLDEMLAENKQEPLPPDKPIIEDEQEPSTPNKQPIDEAIEPSPPIEEPVISRNIEPQSQIVAEVAPPISKASLSSPRSSSLDALGGGSLEYYSGTPHIEVVTKPATRFYGEAYVPSGVVFRCYGIAEGSVTLDDFATATYTINVQNNTAQSTKTPAGVYTTFCDTSLTGVEIGGTTIPVYSGAGYPGGSII